MVAEETSIETQLALMNQMWDQHTKQDMVQFKELNDALKSLDLKVDALLLREAHVTGETNATRRLAGYISALVSLVVSVAGVLVGIFVV